MTYSGELCQICSPYSLPSYSQEESLASGIVSFQPASEKSIQYFSGSTITELMANGLDWIQKISAQESVESLDCRISLY